MNDLECDHCGGTNFYKDAGFFYCSECQIQSQEVQEQVFQDEETYVAKHGTKLVKEKPAKATDNNRLTSWECYNYILYGLTDELIQLGANDNLKQVVKLLWLRYLEKLQVFRRDRDELPKLQAVSSNGDAQIIYGKRVKRKRKSSIKSSSDDGDLSSLTANSIKRLEAKKKRAFIKVHYDKLTENTTDTPSLHNETLLSLQASSDKTSKSKSSISYNIYATKELYRKQSKYHLRQHRNDLECDMGCHQLKYKKLSNNYITSLLIIRDRLQLGDLLRFLHEGKLSFKRYSQFFPDDIERKYCNFQDKHKNCTFNNTNIRKRTSDLAEFLNVTNYINPSDFIDLTQRYCYELNLPTVINNYVLTIIKITDMKMEYCKQHKIIPNYEGRILSIILFIMKLFYGFDGVTEFKLNHLIEIVNQQTQLKQFEVIEWLKYLEYRSFVLKQSNFNNNLNLYLDMLMKRKFSDIKLNQKCKQFRDVLTEFNQKLPTFEWEAEHKKTTLTPRRDHFNILQETQLFAKLDRDFSHDSLELLLKYGKKMPPIRWVHGGGNNEVIVEKLVCLSKEMEKSVENRKKFVTVVPVVGVPPHQSVAPSNGDDPEDFLKNYNDANRKHYAKTKQRLARNIDCDLDHLDGDDRNGDYVEFHTPFERYWFRGRLSLDRLHGKQSKKFVQQLPYTFRVMFKECQRMTQQGELEFLKEFLWTETHLVFNFKYGRNSIDRSVHQNKILANFCKNTVKYW